VTIWLLKCQLLLFEIKYTEFDLKFDLKALLKCQLLLSEIKHTEFDLKKQMVWGNTTTFTKDRSESGLKVLQNANSISLSFPDLCLT